MREKGNAWSDFAAAAGRKGGRLPTVAELERDGIISDNNVWVPVLKQDGDKETGDASARQEFDENCWARIGPDKRYHVEWPSWTTNLGDRVKQVVLFAYNDKEAVKETDEFDFKAYKKRMDEVQLDGHMVGAVVGSYCSFLILVASGFVSFVKSAENKVSSGY